MTILYPASLDAFANPGAATLEDAPGFEHDVQHSNVNDAVEILEAKVGISESVPVNTPVANTVLASDTAGRSKWRQVAAADLAAGAAMKVLFDSVAGGGGASSFDINGVIPATYRSLYLELYLRGDTAALSTAALLRLNNSSDAWYDEEFIIGTGATASAAAIVGGTSMNIGNASAASATGGIATFIQVWLPNYAKTSGVFQQSILAHYGTNSDADGSPLAAELSAGTIRGWWRGSSVVNRVTITPTAGNWAQHSRCTLWALPV